MSVRDIRRAGVTWVFDGASAKPPALLGARGLTASVDPVTESEYLRAQRLGQAKFRSDLMRRWSGRSALTQIAMLEILRASHIKFGRDSTARERINPRNRLLLAVHVDGPFDRGFPSFGEDGRTIPSESSAPRTREVLVLTSQTQILGLTDENRRVLHHHGKHEDRLGSS